MTKIVKEEIPHEREICITLILRYLEKMNTDNKYERSVWHTQILKELNHII